MSEPLTFNEKHLVISTTIGVNPKGKFGTVFKDAQEHYYTAQTIAMCKVNDTLSYAAVAKYQDDMSNPGAVFIFTKTGDNAWTCTQKLEGQSRAYDRFGISVDMAGEILVIGSMTHYISEPHDTSSERGGVYVFKRDAGGIYQPHNPLGLVEGYNTAIRGTGAWPTLSAGQIDTSLPHVLLAPGYSQSGHGHMVSLTYDGTDEYRLAVFASWSGWGESFYMYKFSTLTPSDGWVASPKISRKPPPGNESSHNGGMISIATKGNMLVVGDSNTKKAYSNQNTGESYGNGEIGEKDNSSLNISHVHIYEYSGGTSVADWQSAANWNNKLPTGYLKNSDWDQTQGLNTVYKKEVQNDGFGYDVSILNDSSILVGSKKGGKAYVYNKDINGIWGGGDFSTTTPIRSVTFPSVNDPYRTENLILRSRDYNISSGFGQFVEAKGGYAVIAAPYHKVNGFSVGAVVVYKISGAASDEWVEINSFIPTNGGYLRVDGDGDLNWTKHTYFGLSGIDFDGKTLLIGSEKVTSQASGGGGVVTYGGSVISVTIDDTSAELQTYLSNLPIVADVTPPVVTSATIDESNFRSLSSGTNTYQGNDRTTDNYHYIVVNFDEPLESKVMDPLKFTLTVNGVARPIFRCNISSSGNLELRVDERIYTGESLSLTYTAGAAGSILSDVGAHHRTPQNVADFTMDVTNNTTETPPPPTLVSVVISEASAGKIIKLKWTHDVYGGFSRTFATLLDKFTITVGGVAVPKVFIDADVVGMGILTSDELGEVHITLQNRVYQGEIVSVQYNHTPVYNEHWATYLRMEWDGVAGEYTVPNFGPVAVTNTVTTLPPTPTELAIAAATIDASANGVSTSDIDIIKTGTYTKISGKATLDNTRKNKIQSLINDVSLTSTQKRKKRRSVLKLLFSQDLALTKMIVPKESLGLPAQFTKSNVVVVKAGEPAVDLTELGDDEGYYAVLNDGETFKLITANTTLTFTRTDDGANEVYGVTATTWTDIIINSDYVSGTFSPVLNTGTLLPNDKVGIDGRDFIIGSVADGGESGSGADPYVYPINSSVPVKLPNRCATYRMFEQGDNYVNVEVGRATKDHQERMIEYAEKLTQVTHNIVCDGYFYHKAFISAEGHTLLVDYTDKKVKCNSDDLSFFKIKQSKKKFSCGEFGDDSHCMTVAWETKEGKKIHTEIMFFPNPHIENGINVIPETTVDSTGLIVTNYKPKLMAIPSISTEKYGKLWKRLKNTNNKFQYKSIKGKNEKWHKH